MLGRVAIWVLVAVVLFTVFKQFDNRTDVAVDTTSYTQFMDDAKAGKIKRVDIQGRKIFVKPNSGSEYQITSPGDLWMVDDLRKDGVAVYGKAEEEPSVWTTIFVSWFPMLLLIGVWIFFMRQMQGGGKGGAFSFGKSKARMLDGVSNPVRFSDVAGCDEAKQEVQEVVDFLRDPSKYQRLGGHIPRGILLVGSPGTGKTLLAKAIAGEAGVPFFTISGSDFVEMFVGVGAARVRDMFETAKKNAPCIIFIDEIDAVGRQRGAGLGGGNDEREQTLNQMLVEMDGFDTGTNVIVIAATNRPDVLDPALLRPGRFDRQVVVPLPDIRGREQILRVHMRKVPIGQDAREDLIARGTPGFSGADLANLVNEAALYAARRNARLVEMIDFENAKDKIMMGAERRGMVMTEEERKNTAYHESGHAVVARMLPGTDPVHKVTIIPRGNGAGGFTLMRPDTDDQMEPKGKYLDNIVMSLGGRVAEELVIQDISAGASADIRQVSRLARVMVTEWGMSDRVGPISYGSEQEVFIGRDYQTHVSYSEHMAAVIDQEVERIVKECLEKARELLSANRDIMENMARLLVERETIYGDEVDMLMERKPLDEIRKFMDDNEHRLKENPFSRKKSVVIPESEVRKAEKPASADDKAEEAGKTDQENSSLPSPGKEADRKDTEE